MLQFFRRYQKFFLVILTVMIVISFSFFGTYDAITSPTQNDGKAVFVASDGEEFSRFELEEMVLFLKSDNIDKLYHGGVWGLNFLNDGVIREDFLESGMGEILAYQYRDTLREDLNQRHQQEQRFTPYQHPQAKFVSAEAIWTMFSPEVKEHFDLLKRASDPTTREALAARAKLFIEEKQFPPAVMRQMLDRQQRQYDWIQYDQSLAQTDLSLFGYHTVEDWFGPRFLHLVAQVVIDSAKLAEQKGYKVTKGEAQADLLRNAQISFQQLGGSSNLPFANSGQYLQEQLRRMQMSDTKAVEIWQRVMLFRRLFHDVGNSVFTDAMLYRSFNNYASQSTEIDLYKLPEAWNLTSFKDMQQAEIYLNAVAERGNSNSLEMPTTARSAADVAQKYPELVQKRYLINLTSVDIKQLETHVTLRSMWEWQGKEASWEALVEEFPDLGQKKAGTAEERLAVISDLDPMTRTRVDVFSRAAIVKEHPEWIDEGLNDGAKEKMVLAVRMKEGYLPIKGNVDRKAFMSLLDSENEASLLRYTADSLNYYRVEVLERGEKQEVLTLAEAKKDGTLETLTRNILQERFNQERLRNSSAYGNAETRFITVRDEVAENYFSDLISKLKAKHGEPKKEEGKNPLDGLAKKRMQVFMEQAAQAIQQPDGPSQFVSQGTREEDAEALTERKLMGEQWKLEKITREAQRDSEDEIEVEELFARKEGSWSPVFSTNKGTLAFYQVARQLPSDATVGSKLDAAQKMLSSEARRLLLSDVLETVPGDRPIGVKYL